MFMQGRDVTALRPGDVIVVRIDTHTVEVRRGDETLGRVPPAKDDCWSFFCQMVKSREDAHGLAYAMASSAGHSYQEVASEKGPYSFEILPAGGRKKK
jgi:hypothetical protein